MLKFPKKTVIYKYILLLRLSISHQSLWNSGVGDVKPIEMADM